MRVCGFGMTPALTSARRSSTRSLKIEYVCVCHMPGDIAEMELVIMSETTATEVSKGKWSNEGMFITYTFPSGGTMEFNLNLLSDTNRFNSMVFGAENAIMNAMGGAKYTELEKRVLGQKRFDVLCTKFWKDPSNDGKGGITKAVFNAEKSRADRLAEQVEKRDEIIAAMQKQLAELIAASTRKGRK